MVEIQRLKSKVSKVNDLAEGPDDLLGIDNNREPDQNDNIPDDLYEIIENFSFDFSEHSEEGASEERAERFVAEFETLRKLQEIVDHIACCLATFMRDIDIMDRNIFSLHDRIQPPVLPNLNADNLDAAGGDLPLDVRVMALLLSQGDNRHVEELLRTVHQNVIVNVNLSYYFKIMIFLLTFNTLLLFKWMLWDAFPAILD
ncbi:unnamed protein product [Callosobruchus maculatus]|uniref:Uncharacterized protein n=1 Tax=Callosobruchus maculatus TaxID=64391 RepID=A0A653D6L0_CALMS|nr:unnamed protein product [Callosobruchus maculatus]